MKLSRIHFLGMPYNYATVDKNLSRSAKPEVNDFYWLKEQGITDIIDLSNKSEDIFNRYDEKSVVENLGMSYHHIPSTTTTVEETKINKFLELMTNIKNKNGKAHIHCILGADRAGLYSFVYKMTNNIGNLLDNLQEWVKKGHDANRYPNLIPGAQEFLKKLPKQ